MSGRRRPGRRGRPTGKLRLRTRPEFTCVEPRVRVCASTSVAVLEYLEVRSEATWAVHRLAPHTRRRGLKIVKCTGAYALPGFANL
eukprot:scaffold38316_cov67-Phaeocystis_antarctica.AAC.2